MSKTSKLLSNVTQAIKNLRAANETPPGEQGDTFGNQMDDYVDGVEQRFKAIINDNDEVTADVNNADTTTDALTVGTESTVTGYGPGVSVDGSGDLVSGNVSDEHIRKVVEKFLVGRDGVDLSYNDSKNKLYIDVVGGGGGPSPDPGGGTTIDNFESQSLGNYRNIGGFSFSSNASQGSSSLKGSGAKSIISTPGDGLPYYPSRGDTIKVDINLQNTSGSQVAFGYATKSFETGLEVQMHFDLGEVLWLETVNGTEQTPFGRQSHNFSTNTWKTLTIDWDSSGGESISYDGVTLNTGSTPRGSGGIYFRCQNTTALFDNLRVV